MTSSVPSINITVDPPHSTDDLHSPLSTGLLSPLAYGSDSGSVPPSPTLSSHSVQYPTTLQLRGNNPEQSSGLTSLNLLAPNTHHRMGSDATSVTDVESVDYRHVSSATTSFTNFDDAPASSKKKSFEIPPSQDEKNAEKEKEKASKKKAKKGDEGDSAQPAQTAHEILLSQDEAIDPAPFAFKPYQLAHMLDPKSMAILASFGGVHGLLRGLGVRADHGLSSSAARSSKGDHGHSRRHHTNHDSQEHIEKLPDIVLTKPGGETAPTVADDGAQFGATLDDRKRVFGENVLPTRISKTLLQLMWLALQDKVLVRRVLILDSVLVAHLSSDSLVSRSRHFASLGLLPGLWNTSTTR